MDNTSKHSEYRGNVIDRYKQMKDDEVEIAQAIEEQQKKLLEAEKKRLSELFAVEGDELDRLMEGYAEGNDLGEYLVNGATLTCTEASLEVFEIPNADDVILDMGTYGEDIRLHTTLMVLENPISVDGMKYATTKDTVMYTNVSPFKCNCNLDIDRSIERDNILADKERNREGVCKHLMELSSEWKNMPLSGKEYLKKNNIIPQSVGGIAQLAASNKIEEVEGAEGITMTSILFCKHGGIIYPITSGQKWIKEVINVKKEILAILEEYKELNQDDRIEKVKEYIARMKEENPEYAEFLERLHEHESRGSGGYESVSFSHLGRYQLGDDALDRIDFKKNGQWTDLAKSLGVTNDKEFLKNETAQEVAVLFYIRWIYYDIVNNGDEIYIGSTIKEQIGDSYYKVDVTLSGLIAAGHLIGGGGLDSALKGKSPWGEAEDENGTNALSYMRDMGGLDLEGVLGGIK